jgi:hypothetical protein
MLKSFSEKFFQGLTGKKPGDLVLTDARRDEIIYNGKRVRSKDYIFDFDVTAPAKVQEKVVTTTARWLFLMTGAAVYNEETVYRINSAKVGINFESVASLSPFRGDVPTDLNTVINELVFAREGQHLPLMVNHHFEEYKNLYYLLDQRVNIKVTIKPTLATDYRMHVLLTGIEIYQGGADE